MLYSYVADYPPLPAKKKKKKHLHTAFVLGSWLHAKLAVFFHLDGYDGGEVKMEHFSNVKKNVSKPIWNLTHMCELPVLLSTAVQKGTKEPLKYTTGKKAMLRS